MRNNIVHPGADELTYEIREIVDVGRKLENFGVEMLWENIGDPVAKGEIVPDWIRNIIQKTIADDDKSFGYSPTKGLLETRKFLVEMRNKEGGTQITEEDILFFNGLGDAISKVYTYLNKNARVIGPNPAYPTHSSAEGAHAGSHHIAYNLNPHRNWLPDIDDMRNKIKYNPAVAGILIINPDNPTGIVYPKPILESIVDIAREFDLFIISDEVYSEIVYGDTKFTSLSEVIGDVPGIAMRGLSKEIPWPGARCGWIETYNKETDKVFERYVKTLVDAKMLEVCSTTLPQWVIPEVFSDKRYSEYLKKKSENYSKKADIAYKILSKVPGIIAPKPNGAFYMSVVFEDGVLSNGQTLPIENKKAKELVEELVGPPHERGKQDISPDKRFVYYLMASTGICVVPLSGFNSDLYGFRITLLETDMDVFENTFNTVAEKIKQYVKS